MSKNGSKNDSSPSYNKGAGGSIVSQSSSVNMKKLSIKKRKSGVVKNKHSVINDLAKANKSRENEKNAMTIMRKN
jgi:hypothetical protein